MAEEEKGPATDEGEGAEAPPQQAVVFEEQKNPAPEESRSIEPEGEPSGASEKAAKPAAQTQDLLPPDLQKQIAEKIRGAQDLLDFAVVKEETAAAHHFFSWRRSSVLYRGDGLPESKGSPWL